MLGSELLINGRLSPVVEAANPTTASAKAACKSIQLKHMFGPGSKFSIKGRFSLSSQKPLITLPQVLTRCQTGVGCPLQPKKSHVTTRGGIGQEANEDVGYRNQISSPSTSIASELKLAG